MKYWRHGYGPTLSAYPVLIHSLFEKRAVIASMTITGPAIINYYENRVPVGLVGREQ